MQKSNKQKWQILWPKPVRRALFLLFTSGVGCTGQLSPRPHLAENPVGHPGAVEGVTPGDQSTGSGGALLPPGAGGAFATLSACQGRPTLGSSIMRRQTNSEYVRNARRLLHVPPATLDPIDLPGESTVNNFENVAALQSISEQHVTQFGSAISKFLKATLEDAAARDAFVGCSPIGTARTACLNQFANTFGRSAYRRPLSAAESTAILALGAVANDDADPYASVSVMARGLLGASTSLFLVELGEPDPNYPGRTDYQLLNPYERVSRAAYLAWGSGPDEWLLDRAGAGELSAATGQAMLAAHLLSDARVKTGQDEFFYRWLRLRDVEQAQRDPVIFPEWNAAIKASMLEETRRLVDEVAWGAGGDFRQLLSTNFSFVDSRMATFYGLPAPASDWSKVTFAASTHRFGLLTQASILTATGRIKPKAILRGKFIQEALLCRKMPSPPADIPPLDKAVVAASASDREKLTAHRTNPVCAACHQLLDPVGFGLDNYDGIGKYTSTDSTGHAINTQGTLAGFTPDSFQGPTELAQILQNSEEFSSCIPQQLFRWATARPNAPEDECALRQLSNEFKIANYDYRSLLSAVLTSEAFQHRNVAQP